MLQENLRAYRKEKGLSQEELAIRLHVVRQTVSKWEKGLSVPDADALLRIAEIFEVPVDALLGAKPAQEAEPGEVALQLARINEQLAVKNRRARRVWKIVAAVLAGILLFNLLLMALSMSALGSYRQKGVSQIVQSVPARSAAAKAPPAAPAGRG